MGLYIIGYLHLLPTALVGTKCFVWLFIFTLDMFLAETELGLIDHVEYFIKENAVEVLTISLNWKNIQSSTEEVETEWQVIQQGFFLIFPLTKRDLLDLILHVPLWYSCGK